MSKAPAGDGVSPHQQEVNRDARTRHRRRTPCPPELHNLGNAYWNLVSPSLYEEAVRRREGRISHLGALVVHTGYHTTFSACFGAPSTPLILMVYARMLRHKTAEHGSSTWLVSTSWSGGSLGVGSRISIARIRAMIRADLHGALSSVPTARPEISARS